MTPRDRAATRWQDEVLAALSEAPGANGDVRGHPQWRRLGGSTRDSHWSVTLGSARYFVKTVDIASRGVLDAEAAGLREIAATRSVRVPEVIACPHDDGTACLVLEWLDIAASGGSAALGRALARLHATTSTRFGAQADNTIGLSPQSNAWTLCWSEFFRGQRLRVQLELAARKGHRGALGREGDRLLERVPELLRDHQPLASLVHGDLWSGNAATLADGTPAIFDPAAYYGDRETDIAMTALFGGFDASFYAAYAALLPLPAGHERRRTLYNLYHVLNHVNIFGESYLPMARRMLAKLLA